MGPTGLTATELRDWCALTGTELGPWDAKAVLVASRAYAAGLAAYAGKDEPRPGTPPASAGEAMRRRMTQGSGEG